MYNNIRPLAFKFDPTNPLMKPSFQSLGFPAAWKKALKELRASSFQTPVDTDKLNLPIKSLNKTLRTLAPDLISVVRGAGTLEVNDWLFCSSSFEPGLLKAIVSSWITVEFAKAPSHNLKLALAQINDEPIDWQPFAIDLTDWTTGKNGTAQEKNGLAYDILPEFIASLLCKPGTVLQHGAVSFSLLRCPTSPGNSVAELVSWPPFYVNDEKKTGPHSLLVSVTVQTVPFQSYPVIYVDLGIRRWVDANDLKGKLKGHTQAYIRTSVSWFAGMDNSQSFQVGRVGWRKDEDKNGEKTFSLAWEDRFGDILKVLNPGHALLDPEWFRKNISAGFTSDNGTSAAFVYNTRMGNHEAGAGLMPGDRHPIFEAIVDRLRDYATPEKQFIRVGPRTIAPNNDIYDFKKMDEDNLRKRRMQIAKEIGSHISVEIHYQRPDTAREIATTLTSYLGFEQPIAPDQVWEKDGLTFALHCTELGPLGSSLILKPDIRNKADQAFDAVQNRIAELMRVIQPSQIPALAIIELGGKDEFESVPNSDPKNALRVGFSHTGRVSQFIDAGSDQPVDKRAQKVIADGFRQLGMLPKLSHVVKVKGHPENMNYVGVWIVRQNPKLGRNTAPRLTPILVHINSQTGKVSATAYGFEDWRDYREALLMMGYGQIQFFDRPDQAQSFIQEKLHELTREGAPILLLCDAQNIRNVWKGMQNRLMMPDVVSFDGNISRPISDFPGLRIIRNRGGNLETPEWYAIEEGEDEDEIGFAKGLFQFDVSNSRVYGSIGAKPVQASTRERK